MFGKRSQTQECWQGQPGFHGPCGSLPVRAPSAPTSPPRLTRRALPTAPSLPRAADYTSRHPAGGASLSRDGGAVARTAGPEAPRRRSERGRAEAPGRHRSGTERGLGTAGPHRAQRGHGEPRAGSRRVPVPPLREGDRPSRPRRGSAPRDRWGRGTGGPGAARGFPQPVLQPHRALGPCRAQPPARPFPALGSRRCQGEAQSPM